MSLPSRPRVPLARPLRVALLAPPFLPVPPSRYGGVERIVGLLADGLVAAGHDVTLFAAGDSQPRCRLVPTVPGALWSKGERPDPARTRALLLDVLELALERDDEFDVIHSHLEATGLAYARRARAPLLTTMHGPMGAEPTARAVARHPEAALVAISHSQRSGCPGANWLATIHNAIEPPTATSTGSGGYLCFLGRINHEKGVAEAIELARRAGLRLLIGAKVHDRAEQELFADVVRPAIADGVAEYVGELDRGARDQLLAGALATVMLHNWAEPFGLVAAESLAVGTPVIARPAGALAEIVRHGVDGFQVDGVDSALAALGRIGELDRATLRAGAEQRFSADRMVSQYAAGYARLLAAAEAEQPRLAARPTRLDEVAPQNV